MTRYHQGAHLVEQRQAAEGRHVRLERTHAQFHGAGNDRLDDLSRWQLLDLQPGIGVVETETLQQLGRVIAVDGTVDGE
jgi:hypothetical protein